MAFILKPYLQSRSAAVLYFLGRLLLAAIFIWSGLSKLTSPVLFADTIGAYGLIPEFLNFPAAVFLIVAELVIGVGLFFEKRGALTATSLLMLLFIAVLGYGIALGLDVDCGCFGPDDPEAAAFHGLRSALGRDLLLMLVIAYLYLWRFGNGSKRNIFPAFSRVTAKEA